MLSQEIHLEPSRIGDSKERRNAASQGDGRTFHTRDKINGPGDKSSSLEQEEEEEFPTDLGEPVSLASPYSNFPRLPLQIKKRILNPKVKHHVLSQYKE